ncbi:MAG TPA: helix-turn-helix domain-containing protein [Candidatus Saccharimonadaceae bacterium]|jgi:predicted DNA-binding transcriptional regulator AlpA|nr:helix-turn-helix domain-containing protein [Candidatus Saccharimonadaceae bacterium]
MDSERRDALERLLAGEVRAQDLTREDAAALLARLAGVQTAVAAQLVAPQLRPLESRQAADRLMSPEEAATVLGVTVRWLYRHAKQLPFAVRLGRKVLRFSEAGLRRYLTQKRS